MGMGKVYFAATMIAVAALASAEPIPEAYKQNGLAIGCQAYSFNRFSVMEAIEKTAKSGARVIEFYPGQKLSREQSDVRWNHTASEENIKQVEAKLKEHDIKAVNYGVVAGKDAEEWRQIFQFAKRLGMFAVTTEDVEDLDIIEPLVKEFDIRLAIHEHPRKVDKPEYRVWDPHYIVEITKDRDPRIGACADTGHWQTSGLNPVYCLRVLKGRVISSHLKDKKDYGPSHNVVFGKGVGEIARCLDELKSQGFEGNISIEHEYNWNANVPDVTKCVEFMKTHQFKEPERSAEE